MLNIIPSRFQLVGDFRKDNMNINFAISAIKALVIVTAFLSGSMWLEEGKGDKCKTWVGISQIVGGVALLIITILYY